MRYPIVISIFLLRAFSLSAQAFSIPDSLAAILRTDTLVPEERFRQSYNLLFHNASPEEARRLSERVIYPFVEAAWPDRPARLARRARLELLMSFVLRERGGQSGGRGERLWMEKAVASAVESGNDTVCARACTAAGYMELKRGDTRRGHDYLYRAIGHYDRMEQWVMSSAMLYVIAGQFHQIRDTAAMARVLGQMERYLRKDRSEQSVYQYHVIKHSYYESLLERSARPDRALVDSARTYIRANIALVENALPRLDPTWMHGYAYYYLAKLLDDHYPAQTDSIFLCLDRADAMRVREEVSRRNESASEQELRIHIGVVRARALRRSGRVGRALAAMREVLVLLDGLQDFENLNDIRSQAYRFMVDCHERSDPAEALRYEKLLAANEARRYESEKLRAANEMSAKYESEKQELRIVALTEQNRAARRILWLTLAGALAALSALIAGLLWNRQRRKNTEQRLYQTALEAELHRNELETLRSPDRDAPLRQAIGRIAQQIAASKGIAAPARQTYLDRLQALAPAALEADWRGAPSPLTAMEIRYLICFRAGMATADIAALMNVEPASVHTVRYRIRKKFPTQTIPFI